MKCAEFLLQANLLVLEGPPIFTSEFSVRHPPKTGRDCRVAKLGNAYTDAIPHG